MTQADGPDPTDPDVAERLRGILTELMLIPGLSGDEGRVAAAIRRMLQAAGLLVETDVFGNLWTTIEGDPDRPSVLLFAHMDQLGFVVRKVEETGFLRLERVGGVPERALAAQAVTVCARTGDLPGVIANKSHHATQADEKYHVVRYRDIYVDAGFTSAADARSAGVDIGTPVVYAPRVMSLGPTRVAGTSVDDRAGCAVLVDVARDVVRRYVAGGADPQNRPTLHVAFTTQEEFNLRGALPLANRLQPAIAIQIDLMLASDTPDAEALGSMALGGGPGLSRFSFHGRGTLNGVIPHPALVDLAERIARRDGISLQSSAQTGVLTDLSYVQHVGHGVAALDLGFPMRYSHSALEVCDLRDLAALKSLLTGLIFGIGPAFPLERFR